MRREFGSVACTLDDRESGVCSSDGGQLRVVTLFVPWP